MQSEIFYKLCFVCLPKYDTINDPYLCLKFDMRNHFLAKLSLLLPYVIMDSFYIYVRGSASFVSRGF